MTIRVRLFARLRDLAGVDTLTLQLSDSGTVAELRQRLLADFPLLSGLLGRCAVAVDDNFAADTLSLRDDCEVAFLPPVSGGLEPRADAKPQAKISLG